MQTQNLDGQGTSHSIDDSTFDPQEFFREHLQRTNDGKIEIVGDDLSAMELALLDTEKRRRGSQAAVAREQARANKSELELNKVRETIVDFKPTNTIDESLKYSDPDEYIKQTLEAQRANPYKEVFDAADQYAQQTVGAQTVQAVLAEHNQMDPSRPLTEEMLNMDLPPRLLSQFEQGAMSPQDFLAQAADVLYRDREVHTDTPPGTPNLGRVGGSTKPSSDGSEEKQMAQYANAVF